MFKQCLLLAILNAKCWFLLGYLKGLINMYSEKIFFPPTCKHCSALQVTPSYNCIVVYPWFWNRLTYCRVGICDQSLHWEFDVQHNTDFHFLPLTWSHILLHQWMLIYHHFIKIVYLTGKIDRITNFVCFLFSAQLCNLQSLLVEKCVWLQTAFTVW